MPTKEKWAAMAEADKKSQRLKGYYKQRSTKSGHINQIFSAVKFRAKRDNILVNLTLEYLISVATDYCPVFGTKLTWTKSFGYKASKNNFPSLDRIKPELGYIEGNVVWVSYLANKMKQNANPKQLHLFANWIKVNIKEE